MESQPKPIEDTEYSRYAWIRSIRTSKNITFLACTDGSKEFQVTIKNGIEINGELKVGASIMVYGNDSTTPKGFYEFLAITVHVIGPSDDTFPIQPKEHSDEFLRTIPELRGRTLKYADRWKIRSVASQAVHDFFHKEGYFQYFTPIITQADCEGAGDTFKAVSDWKEADLTVSGQLHLEAGMMSLGKVYNFQPCFRAEKSDTRKHLAEFWMIEAESFGHMNLEWTMDLCERLVKHVVKRVSVLQEHPEAFRVAKDPSSHWSNAELLDILTQGKKALEFQDYTLAAELKAKEKLGKWPRISYAQACQDLYYSWGNDIDSEAEKKLTEMYKGPVFITHYPQEMKPFYMRKHDGVAYCFDLIFPEVGELAGGSEREYDYNKLEQAMREGGMDMEKMQWYLNTRKWGSVPHAGFGLGFERLVMYLTNAEKVHDTIPFPVSY